MFWQKKLFQVLFSSPPGLTPKGAGHSQVGVSELKVWRPLQYHQTFFAKVWKYEENDHYIEYISFKSM